MPTIFPPRRSAAPADTAAARSGERTAGRAAAAEQPPYYGAADRSAIPFAEKVKLREAIDAAARARDPRVARSAPASRAAGRSSRSSAPTASSPPTSARWCGSTSGSSPKQRDRRETGSFGIGGRWLYDRLFEPENWNRAIDTALAQALINLESVDAPAGEMTVLLGPGWPGVLLHEAVGHGLEGDFNRKGTSAFSGRIGERVAAPGVTVVDDGAIENRRGSLTIDDEGTPTQHGADRGRHPQGLYAGPAQCAADGDRADRQRPPRSFAHAPMPRMTNTFMLGGEDDPAELLSRVKNGIFAKSFGGGQVDIASGKFVFSCTEAYRIESGKLGAPIKGATLIGDGPSVLTRVKGIGNDMALDEGVGICGKAGQTSRPASASRPC